MLACVLVSLPGVLRELEMGVDDFLLMFYVLCSCTTLRVKAVRLTLFLFISPFHTKCIILFVFSHTHNLNETQMLHEKEMNH